MRVSSHCSPQGPDTATFQPLLLTNDKFTELPFGPRTSFISFFDRSNFKQVINNYVKENYGAALFSFFSSSRKYLSVHTDGGKSSAKLLISREWNFNETSKGWLAGWVGGWWWLTFSFNCFSSSYKVEPLNFAHYLEHKHAKVSN